MRAAGVIDEPAFPAAHDHLAWVGRGPTDFAATARHVFAAASEGERLVLVSADGSDAGLAADHGADLASGRLVIMNGAEAYGPVLDAGSATDQLRIFDRFLDDALAEGHTGLRVVADNTAMVSGTEAQAHAWLAWEQLTDRWQAHRPVTGNCWFDTSLVPADRLRLARCRHPASVGDGPSWRVYWENGPTHGLHLALAGEVDPADVGDLSAALADALDLDVDDPAATTLSLRRSTYLHHRAVFAINDLAGHGRGLHVVDVPPPVARLLDHLPPLPGFAGRTEPLPGR